MDFKSFNEQNFKDARLPALDIKDIEQKVEVALLKDSDLNVFVSKTTARNGIKQFIQMGLATMTDLSDRADFDEIFNPDKVPTTQQYIMTEFEKVCTVMTQRSVLLKAFSNAKAYEALNRRIIDTLYLTIKDFLFNIRIKMLLLSQMPKKDGTKTPITFDKDISLTGFSTEKEVETGLEKLNEVLESFGTPSDKHTKFSTDNPNLRIKGQFYPSDFIIVWNSPFKNKTRKYFANLYNYKLMKEDGLQEKSYDFSKITETDFFDKAMTNAEKTAITKLPFLLIHKNAMVEISPGSMGTWDYRRGNDNAHIYKSAVLYGFGRLPWYPMIKFKIA